MKPRDDPLHDKLFRIRPLLSLLNRQFATQYQPGQAVTVDEMMIAFTGRSSMKQYMPLKPVRRGFKIWVEADVNLGHIYLVDPYTGKEGQTAAKQLGGRVLTMMSQLLPDITGYIQHADRYFSYVSAAEELLQYEKPIYYCGTIMSNRLELPDAVRDVKELKKMERGEFIAYRKPDVDIAVVVWKDKQPLHIITTAYPVYGPTHVSRKDQSGTKVDYPCPPCVAAYNKGMGGVDRADQNLSYYQIGINTKKWQHRFMFRLFDISILNAYLVSGRQGERDGHKTFRLKLARQLMSDFSSRRARGRPAIQPAVQPRAPHHLARLPGRKQQCRQCQRSNQRARQNPQLPPPRRPRETVYGCTDCAVHLCIETCFDAWHAA